MTDGSGESGVPTGIPTDHLKVPLPEWASEGVMKWIFTGLIFGGLMLFFAYAVVITCKFGSRLSSFHQRINDLNRTKNANEDDQFTELTA